ncbi:MAG: ROK family protein [Bacteroidales bacterium]|nr:ROK family protein [Bacteroidales bacterium]
MATRLILLDVGGSYIKCADGRKIPIPSRGSREAIAAALQEAVEMPGQAGHDERVAGHDAPVTPDLIGGLGIAIPGPFDFHEGVFLMKHKYAGVYGERFRDLAGIPDTVPVKFMHDVNAPLIGALRMLGLRNAALVTIGTGLGFSYALDGVVKENPEGSPALSLWNRPWKDGILEDIVSARGISTAYTRKSGQPCSSAYDVAKKANAGDLAALEAYSEAGATLGEALQPLMEELGIDTLLMGGQISKSLNLMIRPLQNALEGVSISQAPEGAVFEGLKTLFEN